MCHAHKQDFGTTGTARSVAKTKQRQYLKEAECNGIIYQVGCSAYVVIDPEAGAEACELEVCEVCQVTKKRRGRKEVPMLECDKCLRGYHLDCLSPPLDAVPEVRRPAFMAYRYIISSLSTKAGLLEASI